MLTLGEFEFGEQGASGGPSKFPEINANGRQAAASWGFPLSIVLDPCKALGMGSSEPFLLHTSTTDNGSKNIRPRQKVRKFGRGKEGAAGAFWSLLEEPGIAADVKLCLPVFYRTVCVVVDNEDRFQVLQPFGDSVLSGQPSLQS
jgi:hypothetical protein